MASSPDVDDEFTVTVKRVPGGLVSNFMLDTIESGTPLDVTLSELAIETFLPADAETADALRALHASLP